MINIDTLEMYSAVYFADLSLPYCIISGSADLLTGSHPEPVCKSLYVPSYWVLVQFFITGFLSQWTSILVVFYDMQSVLVAQLVERLGYTYVFAKGVSDQSSRPADSIEIHLQ